MNAMEEAKNGISRGIHVSRGTTQVGIGIRLLEQRLDRDQMREKRSEW